MVPWEDITTESQRFRKQVANEGDFFVKDDWKVSRHLTLNLGVRWEYYGSPYLRGGYTSSIADQGGGLFGAGRSNTRFSNWMAPGNLYLTGYGAGVPAASALSCQKSVTQSALLPVSTCDPNKLTTLIYVGPGSTLPAQTTIPNDYNNFGPAVGFAWQQGNTAVRGGMQVTFGGSGRNGGATENLLGNVTGNNSTGTLNTADFTSITTGLGSGARPHRRAGDGSRQTDGSCSPGRTDSHLQPQYNVHRIRSGIRDTLRSELHDVGDTKRRQELHHRCALRRHHWQEEIGHHQPESAQCVLQQGTLQTLSRRLAQDWTLRCLIRCLRGESEPRRRGARCDSTYGPVGTVVGGIMQTGSAALRRNATFATNLQSEISTQSPPPEHVLAALR